VEELQCLAEIVETGLAAKGEGSLITSGLGEAGRTGGPGWCGGGGEASVSGGSSSVNRW
jgi:hypothetical protein